MPSALVDVEGGVAERLAERIDSGAVLPGTRVLNERGWIGDEVSPRAS